MKDIIWFGGDSFTWGEGLELYLDTPYWINERNQRNTWLELELKQTDESKIFRECNRFANIVSKHFNTDSLILDYNGGGFDASPTFFDLYSEKIPKAVIYQFTTFDRFNLHFSRFCKCDFCNNPKYGGARPFMMYLECVHKKINNIPLTDNELYHLKWLETHKKIHFLDITLENILEIALEQFIPLFLDSMQIFINDYLKKWIDYTNVYLIDSWDEYTSNVIHTIPELKSKIIPLKGWDGNWYYKWKEWETTFPYKRILNEFPITENGHPTLLQHQYIAESIIHAMEK